MYSARYVPTCTIRTHTVRTVATSCNHSTAQGAAVLLLTSLHAYPRLLVCMPTSQGAAVYADAPRRKAGRHCAHTEYLTGRGSQGPSLRAKVRSQVQSVQAALVSGRQLHTVKEALPVRYTVHLSAG